MAGSLRGLGSLGRAQVGPICSTCLAGQWAWLTHHVGHIQCVFALLEAVLGAVLSKKSPVIGSLGLKVGFGTFQSDQYWLNKKFKEAKNMASKREKKYGTSEIRKTSDGL